MKLIVWLSLTIYKSDHKEPVSRGTLFVYSSPTGWPAPWDPENLFYSNVSNLTFAWCASIWCNSCSALRIRLTQRLVSSSPHVSWRLKGNPAGPAGRSCPPLTGLASASVAQRQEQLSDPLHDMPMAATTLSTHETKIGHASHRFAPAMPWHRFQERLFWHCRPWKIGTAWQQVRDKTSGFKKTGLQSLKFCASLDSLSHSRRSKINY